MSAGDRRSICAKLASQDRVWLTGRTPSMRSTYTTSPLNSTRCLGSHTSMSPGVWAPPR